MVLAGPEICKFLPGKRGFPSKMEVRGDPEGGGCCSVG